MTKKRTATFEQPPEIRRKERATISSRRNLEALDAALSMAQRSCSDLTTTGSSERDPVAYRIGDEAFDQIETLRKKIRKIVLG